MAEVVAPTGNPSQQPLQQEQPQSIPEHFLYKNRLQEYTQKSKIPTPVYQSVNEGSQHVPKFRTNVVVDGKTYTSSNTFSNRKSAELDVARIALEAISKTIMDGVSSKTNVEEFPPIYEDRVFCKSILNEFAVKTNLEMPKYNTVTLNGMIPTFVSSLNFNGVAYVGEPGVTKKEAEQFAARAVILSILGNSEANKPLFGIIKSKTELFNTVRKRTCPNLDTGVSPVGLNSGSDNGATATKEKFPTGVSPMGSNSGSDDGATATKEKFPTGVSPVGLNSDSDNGATATKEKFPTGVSPMGSNSESDDGATATKENFPGDDDQTGRVIENAVLEAVQHQWPDVPGHEFRKPIAETVSQQIQLPITLAPSNQVQPTLHELAGGEKQKCKKRKRANKKMKTELMNQIVS